MTSNDVLMAEVDKRTNLAFSNEMEMLTFYLTDGQLYGLNVFKIIEILECPKTITKVPHSHPTIKGEINFRGRPIALIDLSQFLGLPPTDYRQTISYVLICEYSTTTQGLLIAQPNILITKSWDEVIKPTGTIFDCGYLTALTYLQEQAIQLLDVEKILVEIVGIDTQVSADLLQRSKSLVRTEHRILAVDDSKAACKLIAATLTQMEIAHSVLDNAPAALILLQETLRPDGSSPFTILFTDIEMPIMDGFTFIRKIKSDPRLRGIHMAVHSSLSNKSNQEKAQQMGANDFIPKFTADNIVSVILKQLEKVDQASSHG